MTATAQVLRPRARRIYIVLLFALLGPAVGAFAMLAVLMSFTAFDGGDLTTWRQSTPLALVLGYIYGSGPAALAGVAYALAPRGLQRLVLSPLMGATIVAVFFAALGPLPPFTLADPRRDLEMYGLLIFSGAAAAFVCAAIARAEVGRPQPQLVILRAVTASPSEARRGATSPPFSEEGMAKRTRWRFDLGAWPFSQRSLARSANGAGRDRPIDG